MRALKDQPPFVDRWQCRFGWHRWTRWSDGKKEGGTLYYVQHHTCGDIGRQEIRKVLRESRGY